MIRGKNSQRGERFIAIILTVCACFLPAGYQFDFYNHIDMIIKYIHNQIDTHIPT
jgi:inner membrane protein